MRTTLIAPLCSWLRVFVLFTPFRTASTCKCIRRRGGGKSFLRLCGRRRELQRGRFVELTSVGEGGIDNHVSAFQVYLPQNKLNFAICVCGACLCVGLRSHSESANGAHKHTAGGPHTNVHAFMRSVSIASRLTRVFRNDRLCRMTRGVLEIFFIVLLAAVLSEAICVLPPSTDALSL